MSSSDSSSSSSASASDDPNPKLKPQPLESQFQSSVTLGGSDEGSVSASVVEQRQQQQGEDSGNGSIGGVVNVENNGHRDGSDREEIIALGVTADEDGGVVWRRANSEVELDVEAPASPSSSGYAGERGSSGASSSSGAGDNSEEDEIEEVGNGDDGGAYGALDAQAEWTPGKRHVDEDDASISWRKRKKHFFILSNSGKPIYSRYGDEHKLAGFSATLQAIISFVENGGDRVKYVKAGMHQVVFLVKGPIYLVCISCTEEPYESLVGQLELLYGQMILILTKSLNRCFEKNPKFDMTPLLGGTDVVFSALIHSFSWNPAAFLHAYTCLPLPYATRQAVGAILQDVADSGVLFAILMCKHRADTYLILLTTRSDAFYHLKDCRIRLETVLLKSNALSEVQRSMVDGGMRVEDLSVDLPQHTGSTSRADDKAPERIRESALVGLGGPAGLWHFLYRSVYLDQYVSSEFSSPIDTHRQQKRLYRAYQKLYVSMHNKGVGPHKTQFRRDENYVLLCWVTPDFELYAAFDPLADKALAIKTCNEVCQWVKDVENEIFLLGAIPFSW
ncbi:unnamed protein product [Linum tenue]|uniref:Vacuolar fusion protein MON1 homolog n=1 Tax=Linum tenue TaxID=586396 RepID=A0AAV0N3P7_9ROSI|nr:unnamed protein product [Linum tenue]